MNTRRIKMGVSVVHIAISKIDISYICNVFIKNASFMFKKFIIDQIFVAN